MMSLRMCPGRKKNSEGPTWRSKCPRSECENDESERPEEVAHATAPRCPRCSRTRHFEEDTGIRPFLEPGKTRQKQGDGSKQLPHCEDREQVHRVAKLRQDRDDRSACEEQHWSMDQVRHSAYQKLECDDDGSRPITDHFRFHHCVFFQKKS